MMNNDSNLKDKEFQELYFKVFGKRISLEEAVDMGSRLLSFYRAVYGPGKDGSVKGS